VAQEADGRRAMEKKLLNSLPTKSRLFQKKIIFLGNKDRHRRERDGHSICGGKEKKGVREPPVIP